MKNDGDLPLPPSRVARFERGSLEFSVAGLLGLGRAQALEMSKRVFARPVALTIDEADAILDDTVEYERIRAWGSAATLFTRLGELSESSQGVAPASGELDA